MKKAFLNPMMKGRFNIEIHYPLHAAMCRETIFGVLCRQANTMQSMDVDI